MKLTGLQIRNMQMLQDLEKMIKELEVKRIEHDLLNKNKYAELYKVYHRLLGGLDERGYKVC
ncbi:hypothetical protein [uncultured Clostridium sp.]|uniref:hypothetical protein n=1 Tax=Terrisporobacter sp. TaxID=1965305 RepID=UPI0025952C7F|nr:hypothetical protein [uncultured Clostridium sp.]